MAVGIKRIHHWFTVVRRIKTWQLLLVIVVFAGMSAFFLRQNNLHMIELRNLVQKADEQNKGLDTAIQNLRQYVNSHMNTSLGDGVALQHSYERAYEAAVQKAASSTNPNAKLYAQVELECRPVYQRTQSFPAYTQCAHDKLSKLAPGQDAFASLQTPSPDLYRINFASPLWSPDIAGISVLLTVLATFLLIGRMLTYAILWLVLRAHR